MNLLKKGFYIAIFCFLGNIASANEIDKTFERATRLIQSDIDSAIAIIQALGKNIQTASDQEQQYYHHKAAFFYNAIGDAQSEINEWQMEIKFVPPHSDTLHMIFERLGAAQMNNGLMDEAFATYTKNEHYYRMKAFPHGLAATYNGLGAVLGRLGQNEKAIQYFLAAVRIFEKLDDKLRLLRTYGNMSIVYNEIEEFEKAFDARKKAYDLAVLIGNEAELHYCEMDLADAYNMLGQVDSAIFYFEKSRVYFEENYNAQCLNAIYNGLGIAYFILGQHELAEAYYIKSIDLLKSSGFVFAIPGTLANYGGILHGIGRYAAGVEACQEALPIAKEIHYLEVEEGICECLYLNFKGLNQYDSALYYFERRLQLHDSISDVSIQKSVLKSELESAHSKEKETIIFSANEELNQAIYLRNFWIFGFLLLLVALLILFVALRQRRKSNQLIRSEKQYLDNLLHNLVHEFRTPLTLIKGPTEELLRQDSANELLKLVDKNSDQMLNLVNQVLDFAKIKAGRLAVMNEMTDLSLFYEDALALFRPLADEKNIQLVNQSRIKGVVVQIDTDKLFKILSNLLTNAIKYSNENAVVSLQSEVQNNEVKLIVQDTGIGISAADQINVFKKFYQVDATITRKGEGTGLGLAFVRELVLLMGGNIKLESELNIGTKLTVILPVETVRETADGAEINLKGNFELRPTTPVSVDKEDSDQEKKQILIIEDNRDLQKFLRQILTNQGFDVRLANNGLEGVAMAEELIPDLVITDVMMPKMDGLQVVQALKSTFATDHIPIIILTAKASFDSMLDGLSAGGDDYLSKPFKSQELLLRVANQIKRQENLHLKYLENSKLDEIPEVKDVLIQKIETLLLEDLSVQISVEELADKCALSRSQLHRKVKFLTGLSTTALLTEMRLNLSKTDLRSSGLSISEIAYKYGYSDPAHYSKLFKKQFNETPTEFKNAAR